jgi:hypothetical protein
MKRDEEIVSGMDDRIVIPQFGSEDVASEHGDNAANVIVTRQVRDDAL